MGLSAFEIDVARGLAQGYPPDMVARQFGIPLVSVERARKNIFRFFHVRDQFRLIEVLSNFRFINSADALELDYLKEQ